MRIFGARKSEILSAACLEIVLLSITGAAAGVACMVFLIKTNILYLPHFFQGMGRIDTLKLVGIAGQTIFLVALIEVIVSMFLLAILLQKDITRLTRGSV